MKARAIKTLFLITFLVIIVIVIRKIIFNNTYKMEYKEYVTESASSYGVEEALIYSIIKNESGFNEKATSVSNAQGLMQIMYSTAQEVSKKNNIELNEEKILNPEINIKIGTIYISNLISKYKNLELALAAYNAGSGNVDKWITQGIINDDASNIENIPYKETNLYVRKVIRDYKIYKKILKYKTLFYTKLSNIKGCFFMAFSDRELLARIVQCEAGGEGDNGMKAVATVV